MKHSLARLARMDGAELGWRGRTAGRRAFDRARTSMGSPRWKRRTLSRILASGVELAAAREAASAGDWNDAHAALARHVLHAKARFAIAPEMRQSAGDSIRNAFPGSARDAAARADRLLLGEYDLLGYRGLRFGDPRAIDWHLDPVHNLRPPKRFWSAVPFLDPVCGDHKIIWELNRHQHWLTLGRAFWLTGDRRYRDHAIAELASWLAANPPLVGVNWASMLELGVRSLSWMWAMNFFVVPEDAENDAGGRGPWLVDLVVALDRQLDQIERNLSYYFSPNTHLLGEALALYVGGLSLPMLKAAPRRAALGRRVLLDEIGRQIASDGGHCERSTHYHRYALDFYLLALIVARINGDAGAARLADAVERMASAARLLADDRGRLPHFGDDDGGGAFPIAGRALDDVSDTLATSGALVGWPPGRVGSATEETMWLLAHPSFASLVGRLPRSSTTSTTWARPAAVPSAALPDTGYFVSRSPGNDHLVFDAGPHGYQNGGHAHADALSLTLTVRGIPLLIDPGTCCYTMDLPLRDRFRSTEMHNTLTIDERPASTTDGPFHWLRTANALARRWRANPGFDYIDASHDGYHPLEHRRRVLTLPGDLIVVADLVSGSGSHRADVHWHVDPRWTLQLSGRKAVFSTGSERVQLLVPKGDIERFSADAATGLGWHAPSYGRLEPSTTLRVSRTAAAPLWIISVLGVNADNPVERVETVPVWAEAGDLEHATALRIVRAASIDHVLMAEPRRPSSGSTRRFGAVETDAAMLFCRVSREGQVTEVALVDGSTVRITGRRRVTIELAGQVPDLHLDLSHATGDVRPRLSPAILDAIVQIGA
jgi:hypothetical protein